MATGTIEFRSAALQRPVRFRFVSPTDTPDFMMGDNPAFRRPMKTAYLLHGYNASGSDWMYCSNVSMFALEFNTMFIFPDGENSFYLDKAGTGAKYCQYVGRELVDYTRRLFRLSDRREDTIIGGYSMGGFGALHTALSFPETFGKVFCLSGALIQHNVEKMEPGFTDMMADYDYYLTTFGTPKALQNSPNDPEFLLKNLKNSQKEIPEIYMAIGTEDFLYGENQLFRQFLAENGVKFTYEEGPGVHDFVFWNEYCHRALKWAFTEE